MSFSDSGPTTTDVYLTESPVGLRRCFLLEMSAAPNDGSRWQAMMVVALAELEPQPAHPLEASGPVEFASRRSSTSVARFGEGAEEQTLVHQPLQRVALIQRRVTWPPMGNGVGQSVELEASEQLEEPALLEVLQDTKVAVIDSIVSRYCLFEDPGILGTELELRAAVAGRAGAGRHIAGAIPY